MTKLEIEPQQSSHKTVILCRGAITSMLGACQEVDLSEINYLRVQVKNNWLIMIFIDSHMQINCPSSHYGENKSWTMNLEACGLLYSSNAELGSTLHSVESAEPEWMPQRMVRAPSSAWLTETVGDPAWAVASPWAHFGRAQAAVTILECVSRQALRVRGARGWTSATSFCGCDLRLSDLTFWGFIKKRVMISVYWALSEEEVVYVLCLIYTK